MKIIPTPKEYLLQLYNEILYQKYRYDHNRFKFDTWLGDIIKSEAKMYFAADNADSL